MDITVQELKQKLEAGEDFLLIDVREPWEYGQFNIGGQLIPMALFMQQVDDFEADRDEEIVLLCRSGARSAAAKAVLMAKGYTNVRNLLGGLLAWTEAFGLVKP